jgi:hypothetical protein
MQSPPIQLEHMARAARNVVETALSPWGGSAACIEAYEAAIHSAAQAQVIVAHTVHLQPARSIVALCADLTRDLGAVQVSAARWILDV